jgi:hypothetical protein
MSVTRTRRSRQLNDPYLDNPFRVLNLSADAPLREVDRAAQKLQMQLRLADPHSENHDRKLIDTDEGDIKRAVQELKDPVKRLRHELFWVRLSQQEKRFWDVAEELREFPQSIGGVAAQRYEAISADTTALQKSHNLAVLFHGQAIALERLRLENNVPEQFAEKHDELWQNALRHWSWVLDSDNFWQVIEKRIDELDDARLTISQVRAMRESEVPRLILEPNVESANHYLLKVDPTNASRHVQYLSSCDLQQNNITQALGRFYDPLVKRMHECIQKYSKRLKDLNVKSRALPGAKLKPSLILLQDSFIDDVQPIIKSINSVGDLPGMGEERAMDEAALLLLDISRSFFVDHDDVERGNRLIDLAIDWASSKSVTDTIRERASILRHNRLWKKLNKLVDRGQYDQAIRLAEQAVEQAAVGEKAEAQEFLRGLSVQIASKLVGEANDADERSQAISLLQRAQAICRDPIYRRKISGWCKPLEKQSTGCAVLLALSAMAAVVLVGVIGLG